MEKVTIRKKIGEQLSMFEDIGNEELYSTKTYWPFEWQKELKGYAQKKLDLSGIEKWRNKSNEQGND